MRSPLSYRRLALPRGTRFLPAFLALLGSGPVVAAPPAAAQHPADAVAADCRSVNVNVAFRGKNLGTSLAQFLAQAQLNDVQILEILKHADETGHAERIRAMGVKVNTVDKKNSAEFFKEGRYYIQLANEQMTINSVPLDHVWYGFRQVNSQFLLEYIEVVAEYPVEPYEVSGQLTTGTWQHNAIAAGLQTLMGVCELPMDATQQSAILDLGRQKYAFNDCGEGLHYHVGTDDDWRMGIIARDCVAKPQRYGNASAQVTLFYGSFEQNKRIYGSTVIEYQWLQIPASTGDL